MAATWALADLRSLRGKSRSLTPVANGATGFGMTRREKDKKQIPRPRRARSVSLGRTFRRGGGAVGVGTGSEGLRGSGSFLQGLKPTLEVIVAWGLKPPPPM